MRFYQSLDASDYYRLNSYDMYIDRTMFLNYLQTYGEIAGDKKAEEMLMQLGSMGVNIDRLTKMAESRNKKNA